ncbi:DUF6510 family protein [Agromyces agglutinans]|uniref:DUF6510 family protein n=1 Tax=Agromyces agglutinans TaxID=2662258 RepID=UPI001C12C8AB|nr:DUF6510 family protein [Agromyces agglutinans]
MMQHVDGNALAGDLADLFGVDLTAMIASCAHCGARGPVAGLVVFRTAMGSVGRCAHCDAVLVVVVEHEGRARASLGGLRALEAAPVQ